MVDYKKIIANIPLFKNAEEIVQIPDSSNDRTKLKIVKNGKSYFVKIVYFVVENIELWKKLYQIYEEESIPVPPLIDVFVLNDLKVTIYIYEYCNVINLEQADLSFGQIKNYGQQVAKYINKMQRKIQGISDYPKGYKDGFYQERLNDLESVVKDSCIQEMLTSYISIKDLENLKEKFTFLFHSINWEENNFIHGDIKCANLMLDEQNELLLSDIDLYPLTSFVFDCEWNIYKSTLDYKKGKCEKYLIAGYFQELFKDGYPQDLEKQFIFVFLGDFFHVLNVYMHNFSNNLEKMQFNFKNALEFIYTIIENKNHFVLKTFLEIEK